MNDLEQKYFELLRRIGALELRQDQRAFTELDRRIAMLEAKYLHKETQRRALCPNA